MIHAYFVPRRNVFVFTGSVGNSRRAPLEAFLRERWSAHAHRISKSFPLPHDGLSAWLRADGTPVLRLLSPVWTDDGWRTTPTDMDVPAELARMLREAKSWEELNETGLG